MALAIAVCMGAFTYINIQLEPWVQDFAGAEEAPPTRTPRPPAEPTESDADESEDQPDPEPTSTPEPEQPLESDQTDEEQPIEEQEDDESDDDEDEAFDPDYRLAGAGDVNFRTEPSTAGGGATIIRPVSPGTELEYLNEEAPVQDPADGTRWMRFRLEDGTEGWLREIDVEPI